jgi:hypothetical protein
MIEVIDKETFMKCLVAPEQKYWIIEWRNDDFYYNGYFIYREYKGHYYQHAYNIDDIFYRMDNLEDYELVDSVGSWQQVIKLQQRQSKLELI